MRSLGVGLAILALLVPGALAAAGQGTMEASGARLEGAVRLAGDEGAARLVGDGPLGLQFHARTLKLERIHERVVDVGGPLGPITGDHHVNDPRETKEFSDATVTFAAGAAGSLVGLRVAGPIEADLEDAQVRPVAGAFLAAMSAEHNNQRCTTVDCLDARGTNEILSSAGETRFRGDLVLIAVGPTVRVASAGETADFTSGASSASTAAFVEQRENARILIQATGVEGTLAQSEGATWFVPRLEAGARAVSLDHADGGLKVGAASYRAHREGVHLRGDILSVFSPPAPGDYDPVDGANDFATAYADAFTVQVSGDVAAVNLRAASVYSQTPASAVGLAAILAAAAGLAVYLWPQIQFHGTSALLPLYSRIQQPEVLENQVRNHIYEIVRGNPGISAREVHRRSQQSWGTVVYHLRQLEKHHIVVSRSVGRTRNYYENHGKYRGMEVQLACLQSARARVLAHVVLTSPGITQEDLVERSGLPQPTTSYYVRKLKAAALVEEVREGRYARYQPHPELARFLQLAESSEAPAGGVAIAVEG